MLGFPLHPPRGQAKVVGRFVGNWRSCLTVSHRVASNGGWQAKIANPLISLVETRVKGEENGAGDGDRTRDVQLGKLSAVFCKMCICSDLQHRKSLACTPACTSFGQQAYVDQLVEAIRFLEKLPLTADKDSSVGS
jgi:hypothetical protein